MSGEDATPFVILDEQTRLLVENLGHSTIVARATDNTVANVDAARDGAEPIAARDAISSPPGSAGGDGGRATASIEAGDEGTVEVAKGATAAQRAGAETEGDGVRESTDQALGSGWYEAHYGASSGRASRSPSALTRIARSTLSPYLFATAARSAPEQPSRDAKAT
jgi:hypothetical protein